MCNNTLAHIPKVTDNISSKCFHIEIRFYLKEIQSHFRQILVHHIINRIFHSWSFHMKFMKLAEGSLHKFHVK